MAFLPILFPLLVAFVLPVAAQRPTVTAPPAQWATDPFYARWVDAGGIPILASEKTPDRAILLAREIVVSMLAARPDLAAELVRQGQRVAIMAPTESTLDIPEQRDWKRPTADDARLTRCERKHYAERIGDVTPGFHPAATRDRPVLSRMSAGEATGGVNPARCCSSPAANAAGVA